MLLKTFVKLSILSWFSRERTSNNSMSRLDLWKFLVLQMINKETKNTEEKIAREQLLRRVFILAYRGEGIKTLYKLESSHFSEALNFALGNITLNSFGIFYELPYYMMDLLYDYKLESSRENFLGWNYIVGEYQ